MALTREYLEFIEECIRNTVGELSEKKMLELGNQGIVDNFILEKIGKTYFKNRGVDHISIDLNGLDGALKLDLSKPEQFVQWQGCFDIVTNSGTSEHVEPKSAQYECFLIIHNCLKVGGIAVHLLPDINELENHGQWKGHCNNYYSRDFFKMLAKKNNYKLVSLEVKNGLVCSCLQKQSDSSFMNERDEFQKYIKRKNSNITYLGINVPIGIHFIRRIIYYIKRFLDIPRMIIRKNR